jgi:APA family basic amino acid/polyamine antiporter
MIASLGLGNVGAIALVANFGVIFSYMLSGIEVAVTRKEGRNAPGSFLSPGYPYTQVFSVVLSAIMLLTLGFQSLIVGTATLIVGLLVHSGHERFAKGGSIKP